MSALYPTLFTPAGWAFSIWGLIFLAEGVFSLWQLLPANGASAAVQKGVGCVRILFMSIFIWTCGWLDHKSSIKSLFFVPPLSAFAP